MAAAQLQRGEGEGRFLLAGELNFDSVPALLKSSEAMFRGVAAIEVDLQGVTRSDSAGLALLIEWARQARQRGQSIRFSGMPSQMRDIVRVSGLDNVLPFDPDAR